MLPPQNLPNLKYKSQQLQDYPIPDLHFFAKMELIPDLHIFVKMELW